jgi:hypothetical protein
MTRIGNYAVCSHTCVTSGCWNGTTKSNLWNRNGAIFRHACAHKPHPDCSEECPAYDFLGTGSNPDAVRRLTEDEYEEFLQQLADDVSMDVDEEPPRFDSPVLTTTQNAEITYLLGGARSNHPVTQFLRPLEIIFIPDATLAIKQKSAALNDLAFVRAQISDDEFSAVKDLVGSVHFISKNKDRYNVIMQEWVSARVSCRVIAKLIARQLYITIIMQRWNRQGSRVDANRRFNISYMQWDTFLAFLKQPLEHPDSWAFLAAADCVMGGFDLDSPYL